MTTSQTKRIQAGAKFIDCASFLSPAVVRAALADGVEGFMKYTKYDNVLRGKYWTRPEWETVLELGGYVMTNWEIQADRATLSSDPYATGLSDGKRNRSWCTSIGYPKDVSAPVSVDQNVTTTNVAKVHPFCRGHWDGDGDDCENIGYLDTDGGRLLADLNPRLWIPGAFYWSPELFALGESLKRQGYSQQQRYVAIAAEASKNSQAIAIQFPSEPAYGIRVDKNLVLKPFNVWCAEYTITPPRPPEVIIPPVVVRPPKPTPAPVPQGDDMALVVNHIVDAEGNPAGYAEFIGFGTPNSTGGWHCRVVEWFGPGGSDYFEKVSADKNVVHQNIVFEALNNMTLLGNPEEIQDMLMDAQGGWARPGIFRRVCRYS